MTLRVSLTIGTCLAVSAVFLGGQRTLSSSAAPQQPTFRSGVEAVQVDVFVADRDGRPVSGLTIDDFEVLEDGAPQTITTFADVNIPIERGVRPPGEPDVLTNDRPEGRIYLIALDEVGTHPDHPESPQKARAFLRRFIDEYFGPNDVAAVVLVGRGRTTDGQDFTSNRRLLLDAIDKFSGGFRQEETPAEFQSPEAGAKGEANLMLRNRMSSLRALTEFMAKMPGRRKAMLYVSEGTGFNMFDIVDYHGETLSIAAEDAHAAMATATRGSLVIYPIDPIGASIDAGSLDARGELAAIANVTGGFSLTASDNFAGAFERIVRENSTYYMLGFNSSSRKRDGRFQRLTVRVKRPGLVVKARDGYVSPLGKARPPSAAGAPRSAFADAIASPVAVGGIPIRVFAAPYKGKDKNAAVVLTIEIDAAQIGFVEVNGRSTGRLDVAYVATDAHRKTHASPRHTVTFAMTSVTRRRVDGTGVRVILRADLPPDRYQLRVAAGSAAKAGSVVYDLDVPDFSKGPLVLSGVSLTASSAAETLTQSVGDPLGDVLPAPPMASRDFAREDTLVAYAEVYENAARSAAHPIEMTSTLVDADGRSVHAVREQRSSTDPRRQSGGYAFAQRIPLADIPAGRYILRVEATTGNPKRTAVSRDIPIRVR